MNNKEEALKTIQDIKLYVNNLRTVLDNKDGFNAYLITIHQLFSKLERLFIELNKDEQ